MEECKHEKITTKFYPTLDEYRRNIVQDCILCKSYRIKVIFNIKIPGLTICSEDTGLWVKGE